MQTVINYLQQLLSSIDLHLELCGFLKAKSSTVWANFVPGSVWERRSVVFSATCSFWCWLNNDNKPNSKVAAGKWKTMSWKRLCWGEETCWTTVGVTPFTLQVIWSPADIKMLISVTLNVLLSGKLLVLTQMDVLQPDPSYSSQQMFCTQTCMLPFFLYFPSGFI